MHVYFPASPVIYASILLKGIFSIHHTFIVNSKSLNRFRSEFTSLRHCLRLFYVCIYTHNKCHLFIIKKNNLCQLNDLMLTNLPYIYDLQKFVENRVSNTEGGQALEYLRRKNTRDRIFSPTILSLSWNEMILIEKDILYYYIVTMHNREWNTCVYMFFTLCLFKKFYFHLKMRKILYIFFLLILIIPLCQQVVYLTLTIYDNITCGNKICSTIIHITPIILYDMHVWTKTIAGTPCSCRRNYRIIVIFFLLICFSLKTIYNTIFYYVCYLWFLISRQIGRYYNFIITWYICTSVTSYCANNSLTPNN